MATAKFLMCMFLVPSGRRTRAPLRYAAKFDVFLSLDRTSALQPGAIQGKKGIQFYHLATLFLQELPMASGVLP